MKIYTCNDFTGFWPVGTSAVIVAEDHEEAWKSLARELDSLGLPTFGFTLQEIDVSIEQVVVLQDGDY